MPLWERREFDIPALIWKLGWKVCPPSVQTAPQDALAHLLEDEEAADVEALLRG